MNNKNVFLFLLDLLVVVGCSLAAMLLMRLYYSALPQYTSFLAEYLLLSLVCSALAVEISQTHRIVFSYATFKSAGNILACSILKTAFLALGLLLLKKLISIPNVFFVVAIDLAFTLVFLICHKSVLMMYRSNTELDEEKAINKLNVFVYGTSPKAISTVIRYEQNNGYNIKGFLTRDRAMDGRIIMDRPVIYLPEDLSDFHIKDVEAIMFAIVGEMAAEQDRLVKVCNERGICILTLPSVENVNYPGLDLHEIKHILEHNFIPDHMSGIERAAKRLIDFSISSVLIVLFSPLMLAVYLALRINDGKPVIFKQERIGRFGRPFNILKFRTMRLDAEAAGPALYSGDDDPRMTKTGKFLRQHHLDELPQLFNVFMGQMSFVGYRPERKVFIDQIVEKDPRYAYLYQIRPGVTSYATLKNGYTDTMEKMLRRLKFDLYYLNHRSLLFDLKILWDTFLNIAIGKKF